MNKTDTPAGERLPHEKCSHGETYPGLSPKLLRLRKPSFTIFIEDGKVKVDTAEDPGKFVVEGDPGDRKQGNGKDRGKSKRFEGTVLALSVALIAAAGVVSAFTRDWDYLKAVAAIAVPAILWVFKA